MKEVAKDVPAGDCLAGQEEGPGAGAGTVCRRSLLAEATAAKATNRRTKAVFIVPKQEAILVSTHYNEHFRKNLNNLIVSLKQQFFKMNVFQDTSLKNHLQIVIQQLTTLKSPPNDDDKKVVLLNSLEESPTHTKILNSLCTSCNMNYR